MSINGTDAVVIEATETRFYKLETDAANAAEIFGVDLPGLEAILGGDAEFPQDFDAQERFKRQAEIESEQFDFDDAWVS
jgi:hypothetical protein